MSNQESRDFQDQPVLQGGYAIDPTLLSAGSGLPEPGQAKAHDPVAASSGLIPEGEYPCVFVSGAIVYIYGQPRAVMDFEVLAASQHSGIVLTFYGLLKKVRNKLTIPPGSKYYVAWCIANGGKRPLRGDRMLMSIFKNKVFRVKVGTANLDKEEIKRYSVVREVVALEAGAP